jgi:hypothetical protein
MMQTPGQMKMLGDRGTCLSAGSHRLHLSRHGSKKEQCCVIFRPIAANDFAA